MLKRLRRLAGTIDALNELTGRGVRWLALVMLFVQLTTVVLRYVFGTSYIAMQEAAVYLHACLFMAGAGYTLLHDEHVRVDILYGSAGPRTRAWIDLVGSLTLVLPTMVVIFAATWPYIVASWSIWEGPMAVGGIPAVFLLKGLVPAFCVLLFLQGVSMAIGRALFLLGVEPSSPVGKPAP